MESFQKYLLSKEGKDKKDKIDKKEKNGKILSFFSDLSLLQPPSLKHTFYNKSKKNFLPFLCFYPFNLQIFLKNVK
jgi:hypothetical protein